MRFSTNIPWTVEYPQAKKMKLDTYLTPYIKINSKRTKDPNVSAKSLRRKVRTKSSVRK